MEFLWWKPSNILYKRRNSLKTLLNWGEIEICLISLNHTKIVKRPWVATSQAAWCDRELQLDQKNEKQREGNIERQSWWRKNSVLSFTLHYWGEARLPNGSLSASHTSKSSVKHSERQLPRLHKEPFCVTRLLLPQPDCVRSVSDRP